MKRIIAFVMVMVAMLTTTACELFPSADKKPNATTPPSCALQLPAGPAKTPAVDIPPDAIPIFVEFHVYDEECVEVYDDFTAEIEIVAYLAPKPDEPEKIRYATIIDWVTKTPVTTPHIYTTQLPFGDYQYIGSGVVYVGFEGIVTLGPWWKFACKITVDGFTIHESEAFNDSPLVTEEKVLCIWP